MDLDPQWFLLALPLAFGLGWLGSRLDLRQRKREPADATRAYTRGLNLLLNEQHDKAIDAFIEAIQRDPETADLHFALGNLFRRRGEVERAVRVHEHLLQRGDLPRADRERAQHALAQDFMQAGLFDRAEEAFRALDGTAYATEAQRALLALYERSRQWSQALEVARRLEQIGLGSFAVRMAHHRCEEAAEADAAGDPAKAEHALAEARRLAPLAPRPLADQGARAARAGDPAGALAAWGELLRLQPHAFNLVARAYAEQALASADPAVQASAWQRLADAYERDPGLDLLAALDRLDPDAGRRQLRRERHLAEHPSMGAALLALEASQEPPPRGLDTHQTALLGRALERSTRPLRRYRCAACGFEAQSHFWQCPGCLGWDTLPPRRVEEL